MLTKRLLPDGGIDVEAKLAGPAVFLDVWAVRDLLEGRDSRPSGAVHGGACCNEWLAPDVHGLGYGTGHNQRQRTDKGSEPPQLSRRTMAPDSTPSSPPWQLARRRADADRDEARRDSEAPLRLYPRLPFAFSPVACAHNAVWREVTRRSKREDVGAERRVRHRSSCAGLGDQTATGRTSVSVQLPTCLRVTSGCIVPEAVNAGRKSDSSAG